MIKRTILIVSNDILFPSLFETLLHRKISELDIIVSKSLYDLDETLYESTINLTLLDSILDQIPSFEVMRYLRMEKRITSPIYFFPDTNTPSYLYKSYVMGASKVIFKPFDPYLITDEIASFVQK